MAYRPRVVDTELRERLASSGAVLIEGPKACGKTATAGEQAASTVFVDTDLSAREALAIDPSLVLDGAAPRLLDEWQVAPALWNQVRRRVDEVGTPGQFILTGSAVPADDATRHTGAGRFSRLRMRPMSLQESGLSSGAISLAALLAGQPARSPEPGLGFAALMEGICVGGWPGMQGLTVKAALRANQDYLDQVRRVDVERVDGAGRDPDKVARVIRSLARNVSSEASVATLAADAGGPEGALSRITVDRYLSALDRLMLLEDLPAWAPHLRSRSTLRSTAKRHLADPSLAVAALGGSPQRLTADLETTGLLFESLVVRDLRVHSQPLGGHVRHYRDSSGLEVDCVIETPDGRWGAFEVKLSPRSVEDAARTLLKFASTVDTRKVGEPACLCVITASGFGYRRADGVDVVPVAALGA